MHPLSYGLSDVGQVRPHNEDSMLADDDIGFYAVADGVGGRAKGEVASAMAVDESVAYIRREQGAKLEQYRKHPSSANLVALRRMVESAVQNACYQVFGLGEMSPDHYGMSTTMSALFTVDDVAVVVAQVGDSRIYRLRRGSSRLMTEDHTLINYHLKQGLITPEEAELSPNKNVITRAVGHRDYVQVDTILYDVKPWDRFLLCSDGLHSYLPDDEVTPMMVGPSREDVVKRLIDMANQRGGKDNITALVVDIEP